MEGHHAISARTQRRQQNRRNRKPQTTARPSHLWRYVAAVAFLLLAAFGALAASNHAPKVSAQASAPAQADTQAPQAAPMVAAPMTAPVTPASYTLPQATSSTAPPAAAPASSDGGDWILAPDNPPLPRTLGDIPPLPVAHSAHDPGFHPVQVQQRQTDGDTIILTCLNPVTNKTEVVVGKSGRDTIFTLNDPAKSHLRTDMIQNVQVGDLVPTRDPQTGKTEYRRVTRTFKHLAHETMTAQLADATGKVVDSLTATPEHPSFVPGRGPIPLGQLGIGTQVVTRAGPPLVIASLVKHEYPQGIPVYNFEVQGDHTYFVGVANGGTWVHNDCAPEFTELYHYTYGESAQAIMESGQVNGSSTPGLWRPWKTGDVYLTNDPNISPLKGFFYGLSPAKQQVVIPVRVPTNQIFNGPGGIRIVPGPISLGHGF